MCGPCLLRSPSLFMKHIIYSLSLFLYFFTLDTIFSHASYILSHHLFLHNEFFSRLLHIILEAFCNILEALLLPQQPHIHVLILVYFLHLTSYLKIHLPNWKKQKCSLSQRIQIDRWMKPEQLKCVLRSPKQK